MVKVIRRSQTHLKCPVTLSPVNKILIDYPVVDSVSRKGEIVNGMFVIRIAAENHNFKA